MTCTLFRGAGRSDRRDLVFKKAPDLLSNTEIEVWGTETAGRIEVPGESRSNGAAWVAALAALGAVLARRRRAVGTA